MSTVIEAHEAQDRFQELLERVERGEEFVIEREGREVATIRPPAEPAPRRRNVRFGTARGMIELLPGWDDPMTEEELAEWYDAPLSTDDD
ncbi:MAG: type II toxin-antitoxin system prevent-host-death family antitoxin [Dehalococcoidia bacterium]|nr:type II toxin-antitoxin system prevent-host-death family antitoxin [Dehalococcoidia bacterium]